MKMQPFQSGYIGILIGIYIGNIYIGIGNFKK